MSDVMARPGLDDEALALTLESIDDFARHELPDARLIELDERDEFPEPIVRAMCGEGLGVQARAFCSRSRPAARAGSSSTRQA